VEYHSAGELGGHLSEAAASEEYSNIRLGDRPTNPRTTPTLLEADERYKSNACKTPQETLGQTASTLIILTQEMLFIFPSVQVTMLLISLHCVVWLPGLISGGVPC